MIFRKHLEKIEACDMKYKPNVRTNLFKRLRILLEESQ
jgi:hypothetical protein